MEQVEGINGDQRKELRYVDPKYGFIVRTYSQSPLLAIKSSSPFVFTALKAAGCSPDSTYLIIRLAQTGLRTERAIFITKEELLILQVTGVFRRKKELFKLKWKDIQKAKIDRNILTVDNQEVLSVFDLDRLSPGSTSFIEISNSVQNWDHLLEESKVTKEESKDYEDARIAQLLYIDAINQISAYLNSPSSHV